MTVRAALVPSTVAVEPGESATFEVRLTNEGVTDESVRIAVEGKARPFSWVGAETVTVAAGQDQVVRVGFHLPRTSTLAAEPLPFRVKVVGGTDSAEVDGVVEVTAFAVLSATLEPPEATGREGSTHQVVVSTRGNAPIDVELSVNASDGSKARVEPATINVHPNRPGKATVHVEPTRRALTGPPRRHPFTVVASAATGAPVEVTGTLLQRAAVASRTLVASGVVAGIAVIALVVALVVLPGDSSPSGANAAATADCPGENHHDTFGIRNLEPAQIRTLPASYAFLRLKSDNCSPMRFNPCEPMHYVQNASVAPPTGAADVRQAFALLGQATGITFVDDGLTDETTRAGPFVPERYGARWAPILVVWEHFPADRTEGLVQIFGNTVAMREQDVVVSARLRFNVDAYNDEFTRTPLEGGFGPPPDSGTGPVGRKYITWGRIILHELAHMAGLGHTSSADELMYPDAAQQTIRPTKFGPGDLEGLRLLGRDAGCLTTPPVRA